MALRNDFLWGFATAAAQIEGGGEEQERAAGKGLSVSGGRSERSERCRGVRA